MKIIIKFSNPDFSEYIKKCSIEYCNGINKTINDFIKNRNEKIIDDIINERIEARFIKIYLINGLIGEIIKERFLNPNNDIINIKDFTIIKEAVEGLILEEDIKRITDEEFEKIKNKLNTGCCKYLVININNSTFTSEIY